MILILIIIGAAFGWYLLWISENHSFKYDGVVLGFGIGFALCFTAILMVCIIALAITYIGLDGDIAKVEAQYNLLTFQVENKLYKEDITNNALRELVVEIEEWNKNIAQTRAMTHNFWAGIFYPDIYTNVDIIYIDNLLPAP